VGGGEGGTEVVAISAGVTAATEAGAAMDAEAGTALDAEASTDGGKSRTGGPGAAVGG